MRRSHFEAFRPVCTTCRPNVETPFHLKLVQVYREEDEHVVEGILECPNPHCRREYPIMDGIPLLVAALRGHIQGNPLSFLLRHDLTPGLESILGDCNGPNSGYDVLRQHLSQYTRDHYGDLDPENDKDEKSESGALLRLLRQGLSHLTEFPQGPVLDMGCSVGRGSFELASRTDALVLGVDLNFSMLQVAARVLREGRVRYPRRRVGMVYDRRDFPVALEGSERVDYWFCDALDLPFTQPGFGFVSSLNLLDCLSSPVSHLESLEGLVHPQGRVALASPYDWNPGASGPEYWIGGHSQRSAEGGSSTTWIRRLLEGGPPFEGYGWKIVGEDERVSWSVRLHERSRVEYHSHLMVLARAMQAD